MSLILLEVHEKYIRAIAFKPDEIIGEFVAWVTEKIEY
jgi:hypothetical protein